MNLRAHAELGAFTVETYADRDSWLIGRARGVAASEVAALFGELPWATERSLYEAKLDPAAFIEPESERLYWGRRLEPLIAEEITIRHGWQLRDYGRHTVLRSRRWPFLSCTLDREILAFDERGPGVAECKNSHWFMREEWDETGAPLWVQIQGQSQLAVTGYRWGVAPVLIGGCEWRMVRFDRDDDMIDLIVEKSAAFMDRLERRDPPEVDGHDSTTEAFKRRWRRDDGTAITLPADALAWDRAIAEAQKKQEDGAKEEALHKNRLREVLATSTYGDLPDRSGRWQWKANKGGVRSLRRVNCPVEKKKGVRR